MELYEKKILSHWDQKNNTKEDFIFVFRFDSKSRMVNTFTYGELLVEKHVSLKKLKVLCLIFFVLI
jgi:hypothetical protein